MSRCWSVAGLLLASLLAACGGGGGADATSGDGSGATGYAPDLSLARPADISPPAQDVRNIQGRLLGFDVVALTRAAPVAAATAVELVSVTESGQDDQVLAQTTTADDGSFSIRVPDVVAWPSARVMLRATLPQGQVHAWAPDGVTTLSFNTEAVRRALLEAPGSGRIPGAPDTGLADFLDAVGAAQTYAETVFSLPAQAEQMMADKRQQLAALAPWGNATAAWRNGQALSLTAIDLGNFVAMAAGSWVEQAPSYDGAPSLAVRFKASSRGDGVVESLSEFGRPWNVDGTWLQKGGSWTVRGGETAAAMDGVMYPYKLADFPLRPRRPVVVRRSGGSMADTDGDGKPEYLNVVVTSEVGLPAIPGCADWTTQGCTGVHVAAAIPIRTVYNFEVTLSADKRVVTSRLNTVRWLRPGAGLTALDNQLQVFSGKEDLSDSQSDPGRLQLLFSRGSMAGRAVPVAAAQTFTEWPSAVAAVLEANADQLTQVLTYLPERRGVLIKTTALGPEELRPEVSPYPVKPLLGYNFTEYDQQTGVQRNKLFVPLGYNRFVDPSSQPMRLVTSLGADKVYAVTCSAADPVIDDSRATQEYSLAVRRYDRVSGQLEATWTRQGQCLDIIVHPTDPARLMLNVLRSRVSGGYFDYQEAVSIVADQVVGVTEVGYGQLDFWGAAAILESQGVGKVYPFRADTGLDPITFNPRASLTGDLKYGTASGYPSQLRSMTPFRSLVSASDFDGHNFLVNPQSGAVVARDPGCPVMDGTGSCPQLAYSTRLFSTTLLSSLLPDNSGVGRVYYRGQSDDSPGNGYRDFTTDRLAVQQVLVRKSPGRWGTVTQTLSW
jgi:hypothetical protein